MKGFNPIHLLPSVIVALGIIVASLAIKFGAGWPLFVGPVVLGIAIVIACVADTRLHDNVPATSVVVRAVVGAIMIASMLLFMDDATRLAQMLPILGAVAWVSLLQRPATRKASDC